MKSIKDLINELNNDLEEIRRRLIDEARLTMEELWKLEDEANELELVISEIEKRL